MTREELLAEVTSLTGAPADQVASDFDSLCASWREAGLMIDADDTTSISEPPPRPRRPYIEWNIGATFAARDTAVAVRVPHWSALDVLEPAMGRLEAAVAIVHHHIDVAVAGRLYAIRIDGELAGPPVSLEQLGAECRAHFLELAARDPDRPLMHGTALAVNGKAWIVIGPRWLRAALLQEWSEQRGDVIADAVVSLLDGNVLPLHLGFEQGVGRSQYSTRDYGEDTRPALVNETNQAIRYTAVPVERRSTVPMPLAAVVQLGESADVGPEAPALVAVSPEQSLLALLRSRPGGVGPISRTAAAALVRAFETAAAWSASVPREGGVRELIAAIRGGDRQQ
jgi:hypothetical protein